MQEPLLSAIPTIEQQINYEVLNTIHNNGGLLFLHPRWPLISALICNFFVCIGFILWYMAPVPFIPSDFFEPLYMIATWPYIMQCFLIWAGFLLFWLLAFVFSFGFIELPPSQSASIRSFLRLISDFESIRWYILANGCLALFGIFAMWVMHRLQPIPFSLASIIVIVAGWAFFYKLYYSRYQLKFQKYLQRCTTSSITPWYMFCSLPLLRAVFPMRIKIKDSPNPKTSVYIVQASSNRPSEQS